MRKPDPGEPSSLENLEQTEILPEKVYQTEKFPEQTEILGIYHLYLNMSLIKHNRIIFSFLCKFFKNTFFSNSRILMLDKNR